MSLLSQVSKPSNRASIITITGNPGTGKSSLAATFPKPIFIRVEDGLQAIPEETRPDAFPVIGSTTDLFDQLKAILKEEHDYQTLVIDSVTQAETLFGDHILATDPKKPKSLATALGGYGAGYGAVAALHSRIRNAAKLINEKRGMHVIFIAHSDVETLDLPDQESYSHYNLRLHKKCTPNYVDNVDMVTYVKLNSYVMGDSGTKKAISDGTRVAVCAPSAAQVSKNRYGIETDVLIEKGINPFIGLIPLL